VKPIAAYDEIGHEIWLATKRLGFLPPSAASAPASEQPG
jgi:hypothetical protein